jgi:hypothetical protein
MSIQVSNHLSRSLLNPVIFTMALPDDVDGIKAVWPAILGDKPVYI